MDISIASSFQLPTLLNNHHCFIRELSSRLGRLLTSKIVFVVNIVDRYRLSSWIIFVFVDRRWGRIILLSACIVCVCICVRLTRWRPFAPLFRDPGPALCDRQVNSCVTRCSVCDARQAYSPCQALKRQAVAWL